MPPPDIVQMMITKNGSKKFIKGVKYESERCKNMDE